MIEATVTPVSAWRLPRSPQGNAIGEDRRPPSTQARWTVTRSTSVPPALRRLPSHGTATVHKEESRRSVVRASAGTSPPRSLQPMIEAPATLISLRRLPWSPQGSVIESGRRPPSTQTTGPATHPEPTVPALHRTAASARQSSQTRSIGTPAASPSIQRSSPTLRSSSLASHRATMRLRRRQPRAAGAALTRKSRR